MVLMDQSSAASRSDQQCAKAEQAPRRCLERDDCASGIAGPEVGDLALAGGNRLGNGADVVVGTSTTALSIGS